MKNDFNTLTDFLGRFGPEVSGKALMAPESDELLLLQRFLEGACDKPERAEACELLRLHPTWLRWVAAQVKMARSRSGGAASDRAD